MIAAHTVHPGVGDHLADPLARRYSPLHIIAAGTAALALWYSAGPLRDFDSLWHPQIGAQIAQLHRVSDLPSWWLGVPEPHGWLTSQWLSEVGMHAATSIGGWRALIVVNVVLMVALIVSLWWVILRRAGSPLITVPVFILVLAGTAGGIQERPQTISLVILPWLSLVCWRLLQGRTPPPPLLIAVVSLFWAQVHGLWVLGPAAFALVALAICADRLPPGPLSWASLWPAAKPSLICLLASMAGVINPHGLGSFLLPFRFRAATSTVSEWLPTNFSLSYTVCWALLLLATFAAWARTNGPVPRSEVLWVLAWTAFGLQSFRSVAPALLMMTPVSLTALLRCASTWPSSAQGPASRRESRMLGGLALAVVTAAVLVAGGRVSTVDPLAETPAASIARWVARQPGTMRVWSFGAPNDALIGLTDRKARLVTDGRTDLWGDAYYQRLIDVQDLAPGWAGALNTFAPQAVVVPRTSALATTLAANGWQARVSDQHFVLLTPGPDAARSGISSTA